MWLFRIVQNINQPAMEYSEGFMVYLSKLFASGRWNYNIAVGPPYQTSFYSPLFYYTLGGLMRVFGDSLVVGRLLVISATVISSALVYLIVYYVTKKKIISLISALLPITQY